MRIRRFHIDSRNLLEIERCAVEVFLGYLEEFASIIEAEVERERVGAVDDRGANGDRLFGMRDGGIAVKCLAGVERFEKFINLDVLHNVVKTLVRGRKSVKGRREMHPAHDRIFAEVKSIVKRYY